MRISITAVLCGAMALAGCATVDPAGDTRTEMEKAVAACAGTIAVGALLGAVIGNNSGSRDGRRGALVGAGVGAGACVVLLAMANEKDKQQVARLQAEAAARGGVQKTEYTGDDGARREITATAGAVFQRAGVPGPGAPTGGTLICRPVAVNVEIAGKGEAAVPEELYCRNPQTRAWERTKLPPSQPGTASV